ncbi:MAG: LacI family DNA-binding transcriptional regulator [Rhodospirillales bacterium]|jgi:LacI family transcriptional regulator|nr:LacI family DNA-binding transcriptional regulator [Rhodospirillales bacterium]
MGARSRPSQKQVAARLGLSAAAVSNILRGKGRFAEETRQRVLQELEQAGYQPRYRRQPILYFGLRTSTPDPLHVLPTFAVLTGLGAESLSEGIEWRADFLPGYDRGSAPPWPDAAAQLDARVAAHRPCGVLVDTGMYHARAFARRLRQAKIPAVLMGHEIDVDGDPAVLVDSFGGAYDATARLIHHGHRRIGLLRWNTAVVSNAAKKFAGYRCALDAHGVPFAPECVLESHSSRGALNQPRQRLGRDAFDRLLVQCGRTPPTAVLVENSFISDSLLYPLREDRGRIPERLAKTVFVHFEDSPLSILESIMSDNLNYPRPNVAVCRIDWEKLGRSAVQLLLQMLCHGGAGGRVMNLKPEIVDM